MDHEPAGLVSAMNSLFGGAATSLIGALVGRLMWHTAEVRRRRRRILGRELVWEMPIALGMAIIGEGVASYFAFTPPISTAIVAALAYLGPRGAENLFERWFSRGKDE